MHTRIKAEIIALAHAVPQEEVCGFIYATAGEARVLPCRNVSPTPDRTFAIDPQDHIRALRKGPLLGVYHSHPTAAAFSLPDLEFATEVALPQFLYSVPDGGWFSHVPKTHRPPLESRAWVLGFHDCYGLIVDYQFQKCGHPMNDYDRDESFSHEEQGVIMANFDREGFEEVSIDEMREHDVLLFRSEKVLPQHFGIYLGFNRFLHHPLGSISQHAMLTDRWQSRLICAFRRKPALVSA